MRKDGGTADRKQTRLPYQKATLDWLPQTNPPCFVVFIGKKPAMVWAIERDSLICVAGQEFLTDAPYDNQKKETQGTNNAEP